MPRLSRRALLRGAGLAGSAALLTGCDAFARNEEAREFLRFGEWLNYRAHRLIVGDALAREFPESAMSPDFRTNGNTMPQNAEWRAHAERAFATYELPVGGMVANPARFSLAALRAMPARSQITRHDCVEGWSAIGKWTGVQLSAILNRVGLSPEARFIVFYCADSFGERPYYESIDLRDAFHPQTILAYGMNDQDLPIGHGAPLRLRVERQLGYKQAKFITRIEAVDSLAPIYGGKGGLWEDTTDYDWYAGI